MLYLGHLVVTLLSSYMCKSASEWIEWSCPCEILPSKRTKQHRWHYPAGQLHVWQNYFHSGWIFIIVQTTGARVCKGAVGCGDCGRSQALTAERVWNAKARLLPCAWRAAKEPGRLSPTERGIKNNLTRLHLETSPGLCFWTLVIITASKSALKHKHVVE